MLDVAATGQELLDLGLIDVESHGAEAGRDKGPDQRQTDIAQANDTDFSGLALNCLFERGTAHGE